MNWTKYLNYVFLIRLWFCWLVRLLKLVLCESPELFIDFSDGMCTSFSFLLGLPLFEDSGFCHVTLFFDFPCWRFLVVFCSFPHSNHLIPTVRVVWWCQTRIFGNNALQQSHEIYIIPCFMSCCFNAYCFSKWTPSSVLSRCFSSNDAINIIKDEFPLSLCVRAFSKRVELSNLSTLCPEIVSRLPLLYYVNQSSFHYISRWYPYLFLLFIINYSKYVFNRFLYDAFESSLCPSLCWPSSHRSASSNSFFCKGIPSASSEVEFLDWPAVWYDV